MLINTCMFVNNTSLVINFVLLTGPIKTLKDIETNKIRP